MSCENVKSGSLPLNLNWIKIEEIDEVRPEPGVQASSYEGLHLTFEAIISSTEDD